MLTTMHILVADDHGLFREGIRSLIESSVSDYQVTCTASFGGIEELLNSNINFQLLLIDLRMPGMQGVKSIRKLITNRPSIPLLVVSAEDSPATIQACLSAGATGYLTKSSDMQTMLLAIKVALAGGQYIPSQARGHKSMPLNHRQEQILTCLAEGQSNHDIADHLGLTEGTVKQYVSNLLRLLDVDNRTQAAARAQTLLGLGSDR